MDKLGLGTTKKKKALVLPALLCLVFLLSLAACADSNKKTVDNATTPISTEAAGPVETAEASPPPEETIDYSADEAETVEPSAYKE